MTDSQFANLKMAIEIEMVSIPIQNRDFPWLSYLTRG